MNTTTLNMEKKNILSKLNQILRNKLNSIKEKYSELETQHEGENAKAYKLKGTPFTITEVDKKWYVLLGQYRLTEAFNTKKEAIEDAKRYDWERIQQVIQVQIEENKKLK